MLGRGRWAVTCSLRAAIGLEAVVDRWRGESVPPAAFLDRRGLKHRELESRDASGGWGTPCLGGAFVLPARVDRMAQDAAQLAGQSQVAVSSTWW